jgi:hypothetical protein
MEFEPVRSRIVNAAEQFHKCVLSSGFSSCKKIMAEPKEPIAAYISGTKKRKGLYSTVKKGKTNITI